MYYSMKIYFIIMVEQVEQITGGCTLSQSWVEVPLIPKYQSGILYMYIVFT